VGLAILRPRFAVSMVAGGSVALGAGALALGVPRRNALALVLLSPIFGVAYGSGIVRGMALRISGKKRGGE
jgi:hypothetical protein